MKGNFITDQDTGRTPIFRRNSADEFKRFIKSFNITHQDMADALSKDVSVVTRWLGGKDNKVQGTVEDVQLLGPLFDHKLNRYDSVSYSKKEIKSILNFFLNVPSTDIITDEQYRRISNQINELAKNVKQLNNSASIFDEYVDAVNANTSTRKLHTKKIAELEKRIDTLFGGEVKPVNEIDIKSLTTDLNVLLENYRRGHDVQNDVETMLSNFNLDSYDKEKVAKNIQLEQLKKFVQEQKDQEAPF